MTHKTQRIKPFLKNDSKNFFFHDSKNLTFFWIWLLKNIFWLKELNLFRIWLKELNFFHDSELNFFMTQRIELFFSEWLKDFVEYDSKKRTFLWIWLKVLNLFFNMTQGIESSFSEWLEDLNFILHVSKN